MSGAINYRLMRKVKQIVDAEVSKEIVDLNNVNEVDLTRTYELAMNMSREELVVFVTAAVQKFPFETYRTLALHAQRGENDQ